MCVGIQKVLGYRVEGRCRGQRGRCCCCCCMLEYALYSDTPTCNTYTSICTHTYIYVCPHRHTCISMIRCVCIIRKVDFGTPWGGGSVLDQDSDSWCDRVCHAQTFMEIDPDLGKFVLYTGTRHSGKRWPSPVCTQKYRESRWRILSFRQLISFDTTAS